jgi:Ca2+-binding RTX toxin-like protein
MSRSKLAVAMVGVAIIFNGWAVPAHAAVTCYGRAATILGTAGGDTLRGTQRADVIIARSGNDRVFGRGGKDRICGGQGSDVIHGGVARDRIAGFLGRDVAYGGDSNDYLAGGEATRTGSSATVAMTSLWMRADALTSSKAATGTIC